MSEAPATAADKPRPRKRTRRRREQLAALLADRGASTSVHDLLAHFDVSEATLRRDLAALSEAGELVRVYGGAAPAHRSEFSWREKALEAAEAKRRIAEFAARELVASGDMVFIDAGTTPAAVARALRDREDVTLVIAGLAALLEVAEGNSRVVVLGGRLRRPSASFLGSAADLLLDLVTPDVAFLGTDYLDPVLGANYPDLEQAAFKSRVIGRSQRSWLVVDESKFPGPAPFGHWARLDARTGIVTTTPSDPAGQAALDAFVGAGHVVHRLGSDRPTEQVSPG